MIQDIAPHRLKNEYRPELAPEPDSPVLHFAENRLLVRTEGDGPFLLTKKELPEDLTCTYLLSLDETAFFLAEGSIAPVPDGCAYLGLKELRYAHNPGQALFYALVTAFHLQHWYASNRYCGRCGQPTRKDGRERALKCPACGNLIFPRINPAVIVGVTKGNEIVLTKYANRDIAYNALIAGFTEIGETFEETVEREVLEEVGLRVKNIRYYKSQPWGFADDILAGFYCEVDGDPTIHMDQNELKTAVWTKREDIVLQPDDYSLTNEMMLRFKEGREGLA